MNLPRILEIIAILPISVALVPILRWTGVTRPAR